MHLILEHVNISNTIITKNRNEMQYNNSYGL